MVHPLKRKKPKAVNTAVSLLPEQVVQLERLAKYYGTKRSPVVAFLIEDLYKQLKKSGDIK